MKKVELCTHPTTGEKLGFLKYGETERSLNTQFVLKKLPPVQALELERRIRTRAAARLGELKKALALKNLLPGFPLAFTHAIERAGHKAGEYQLIVLSANTPMHLVEEHKRQETLDTIRKHFKQLQDDVETIASFYK